MTNFVDYCEFLSYNLLRVLGLRVFGKTAPPSLQAPLYPGAPLQRRTIKALIFNSMSSPARQIEAYQEAPNRLNCAPTFGPQRDAGPAQRRPGNARRKFLLPL